MPRKPPDPDACRRCGECCLAGGPVLHAEDLDLIRSGIVGLDDMVTLRAGEPVMDQPRGATVRLAAEAVKVRGADPSTTPAGQAWACCFYRPEDKACAIYDTRPAECRALFCGDPSALEAMYERERIGRADILPPGHPLLELIAEQEARCPVGPAVDLAEAIIRSEPGRRQALADELAPMVAWDRQVRAALSARAPEGLKDLARAEHFLLGRPLHRVLAPMGLDLDPDTGSLRLRTAPVSPTPRSRP